MIPVIQDGVLYIRHGSELMAYNIKAKQIKMCEQITTLIDRTFAFYREIYDEVVKNH
jgi:hypothetical protein